MSHVLTEADSFPSDVTVPDGTDSRNNASAVVTAIAQVLANRTKHLNLHVAWRDQANTFTDVNTFDELITALTGIEANNDDASTAALVVRTTANDDAHAGNKFKAIGGFQIGDSYGYVNIYTGNASSEAQYIITLNAVWNISSQTWHADNTGQASLALLFKQSTGLQVSRRPAGSGSWATWPTAVGDLTASGDFKVTTGDFKYAPARTRTTLIPLTQAVGVTFFVTRAEGGISIDAADIILLPLKLPHGAVVHTVEVMIDPGGSSAVTVKAEKRIGHTWGGSPAAPTGSAVATASTSGSSLQVVSVDFGGLTLDSSDQEFWISITGGNTGDIVWGARIVGWSDPGPINI